MMKGKTYTLAVGYSGGVICGHTTLPSENPSSDEYISVVTSKSGVPGVRFVVNANYATLYYQIIVAAGESVTIQWAALYEGAYTADTLPAYVYKGYAAELAECMRYYQVFGKKRLVQSTQPNGGFSISERFAIPMRVAPTITGTYVAWSTVASGNTVVEQTAALATSESRADGFRGYYTVGIATELMLLDFAFTASADL